MAVRRCRISNHIRLQRLRAQLEDAGHRAYSIDNIAGAAAVKAFERVEKLRARIKEVEAEITKEQDAPSPT